MNRVALLIGGNQGDRQALIERATALIQERIGTVALVSSIYETEPWGEFEMDSRERRVENFMNRGLLVETALSAHEVLREALSIEADLGRVRPALSSHVYRSRPMDIDIIFFNNDIIDTGELVVPHPRAHLRRFVLEPLAEIIPDYIHPILGRTVRDLLGSV